jgi:hypothetical protein
MVFSKWLPAGSLPTACRDAGYVGHGPTIAGLRVVNGNWLLAPGYRLLTPDFYLLNFLSKYYILMTID